MRRQPILLALLATPLLADKVTYEDDVLPIFQQACLNCHNPDKARGGLDLSTFGGAMKGGSGGRIVEPGDTGSTLISLVKQTAEPKMPPEGDKLSNDLIAVLERWIEGGLLETKSSSARKPTRPKFEAALRSDPAAKPDGPPPMPEHVLLDPPVVTERAAAVHSLAASPWAPLLAVTGQRQVLLYHTGTLELIGILPFPEGEPVSLSFTPDARYLVVGGGVAGKSGVTVTFDVTNGERLLSAGREFDAVLAGDIRPSFDIVATGGPSRLLKLWSTETGDLVTSIKKHTDWITALDISPDGVLLASGDRNGGVWVWESDTGNEFHTLRGHDATIVDAVFRADSNVLATASEDGTVRYWEMTAGNEIRKNDAHPGGVTALSFSRDGRSLTVGRDLKAKLWKTDFGHERDIVGDLPGLPTAVALDAEGTRAFIADALGAIRVFDTADGAPLGEFHTNPPSIAARLVALDASLTSRRGDLDALRATAAQVKSASAAAATAVAKAEEAVRGSQKIHAAAADGTGEASAKLEESRRELAAVRERLAAAEIRRAETDEAAKAADPGDPEAVASAVEFFREAEEHLAALARETTELEAREQSLGGTIAGAAKAAEAAEARVTTAQEKLEAARTALAEAEAAAAEAVAAVSPAEESVASAERLLKHWNAAAINTQALEARRHAAEAEAESLALLDDYAAALEALEGPAAALAEKRAERKKLVATIAQTADPAEVEAEATEAEKNDPQEEMSALVLVIGRFEAECSALEKTVLELRESSQRAVGEAHEAASRAAELTAAYFLASGQAPPEESPAAEPAE